MNYDEYEEHMKKLASETTSIPKEKPISSPPKPLETAFTYSIQPLWLQTADPTDTQHIQTTLPYTLEDEIYCVKFSYDGEVIATTAANGTMRIFNAATGALRSVLNQNTTSRSSIMSFRWRPQSKTKQVLLSCNIDGHALQWHIPSKKVLSEIWTKDNPLYACDYNSSGDQYAVGGKDHKVYIYDSHSQVLVDALEGGDAQQKTSGNAMRIYSIRGSPCHAHLYYSAGWCNTVQAWDTRVGKRSVMSIPNVMVRGEGLDVSSDGVALLVASAREKKCLEIYDLRRWNLPNGVTDFVTPSNLSGFNLPLQTGLALEYSREPTYLYSCKFSNGGKMIAAGGGLNSNNSAAIFDIQNLQKPSCLGMVGGVPKPVYSVDFSPFNDKLAVGGGDGTLRVLSLNRTSV